jgi:hypothetical protein
MLNKKGNEMARYTYSDSCYSDLHKDARGTRPSFGNVEYWESLSPAEKQKQWDGLIEEMNERHENELREEREAIRDFEVRIKETIAVGAKSREQAIAWMMIAEDLIPGYDFDVEHFEWKLGLPFGYISK